MKKIIICLSVIAVMAACTKEDIAENDEFQIEERVELPTNQIEAVDGTKIKRPGSGDN